MPQLWRPLVSRVREPIPRGDGGRALGRPGGRPPTFPSWNDGPSSHEYVSRSPAGMARGPWGGPADARQLPLARPRVLPPTGALNEAPEFTRDSPLLS